MINVLRSMAASTLALGALGALAACTSSGSGTGSSSSSAASGTLSKAEFITQMDAECASVLAKLKAIPSPTGPTDFAAILNLDAFTESAEPAFQQAAAALVDRSPDAAALHKNWIDVDKADFAAQQPFLAKFDAAAKAHNATQLTALANQAQSVPDHSATEATYLKGYGLTDCAALEDYGNS